MAQKPGILIKPAVLFAYKLLCEQERVLPITQCEIILSAHEKRVAVGPTKTFVYGEL